MRPAERSLKELRKHGYIVAKVERWNQFAYKRQDLFGFADILAVHPKRVGCLFIQCFSHGGGEMDLHQERILFSDSAKICSEAGNRIELWGWRKYKPRGRREQWRLIKRRIRTSDFD